MALIENTGIERDKLMAALPLWRGLEGARAELINHTENATFRLDLPGGAKKILRVHRPGYNTSEAVRSELAWAKALREDAGVLTPIAVAGANSGLVQSAVVGTSDASQMMVLFEFEEGREPKETDDLAPWFVELGRSLPLPITMCKLGNCRRDLSGCVGQMPAFLIPMAFGAIGVMRPA